jgi:hypothetical protein
VLTNKLIFFEHDLGESNISNEIEGK